MQGEMTRATNAAQAQALATANQAAANANLADAIWALIRYDMGTVIPKYSPYTG